MRRTGSAALSPIAARNARPRASPWCGGLLTLFLASTALAAANFHQQVDRSEVGTDDTFTLTVVWEDPPGDGVIIPPKSPDFGGMITPSAGGSSQTTVSVKVSSVPTSVRSTC